MDSHWIRYGRSEIQEVKNWLIKYPTGPVHWVVRDPYTKEVISECVRANELSELLVSLGRLIRW